MPSIFDRPSVLASTTVSPLTTATNTSAASVLFIDAGVENRTQLIAGASAGTAVYELKAGDAIGQITQVLSGLRDVSSVQIISHGRSGGLQLGANWLDAQTLPTYTQQLKSWGQALAAGADVLLYGCNVAEGEVGRSFVSSLAETIGADVAASDDLTGNAALGGDWDLEVRSGTIEAVQALTETSGYQQILANFIVTNANDSGSGSLRDAVNQANALAGADTISFGGPTFTDATPDVINLATGLTLSDSVTINGTGADRLMLKAASSTSSPNTSINLLTTSSGANITINDVALVDGNYGIFNQFGGILSVSNSIFSNNNNGIVNSGTLSLLTNSTISEYTYQGIYSTGIIDTISNSTFQSKTGLGFAGVRSTSAGRIKNINNVTIVSRDNGVELDGTSIVESFTNSIVVANKLVATYSSSSVTSQANNFFGTFSQLGLSDQLALNGGKIPTFALLSTSSAINASGANATTTDQRGVAAIGKRDAGAFEFIPSSPPQLIFSNTPIAYIENGPAIAIDSTATITDPDSTNFNNGVLTISLTNAVAADRLTIQTANGITLDGRKVFAGGFQIGTIDVNNQGINGILKINLLAGATPILTRDLLRSIAYSNVSDSLTTGTRDISVVLTDGSGGTSTAVNKTVNVTGVNDAPFIGGTTTLYKPGTNPNTNVINTINNSGWLQLRSANGAPIESPTATGTTLNSSSAIETYTGYTNYASTSGAIPLFTGSKVNPNFPQLDRTAGYTLSFTAKMLAEVHANSDRNGDGQGDRAGFSVIVNSEDLKGIELGFWNDRIFAQEDGSTQTTKELQPTVASNTDDHLTFFTQAESVVFNTTGDINYDLVVQGDFYTLYAIQGSNPRTAILRGKLRDYSAFVPPAIPGVNPDQLNPYNKRSFVFLGDNTSDASASVNISNISISTKANAATFSIDENSTNNTIVGKVNAIDVDANQTLTYSITAGNTGNAFAIDANGNITVADSTKLNFEGPNKNYSLTVQAQDNGTGTLSDSKTITINLTDVNEAPVVTADTFSIAENSANSTVVGRVIATDVDAGQSLTYSITAGNTGNAFAIDNSGNITVNDSTKLNFEGIPKTYNLTVRAQDNGTGTLSDSKTITINVTDVNEAPVVTANTFSIAENSANNTFIGRVIASDVDANQTLSYSITAGNTGNAFAIDNNGNITVNDSTKLNFEGTNSYSLTVRAQDNGTGTLSDSKTITINLTDVNEVPVVTASTFSIAENSANNTLVGRVIATDVDANQALTYSITAGNTDNAFAIDSNGNITVNDSTKLNFEGANKTYSLTVQAQDNGTGTLSDSKTITINVTDVNEAPTISPIATQRLFKNNMSEPIGFTVGDPETAAKDLTVTVSSFDSTLIDKIEFVGSGADRSFMITPKADKIGSSQIKIKVSDGVKETETTFQLDLFQPAPENTFILRDSSNGTSVAWGTVNSKVTAGDYFKLENGTVINPDSNWKIVSNQSDFNGDGIRDIVWFNKISTDSAIWYMGMGSDNLANIIKQSTLLYLPNATASVKLGADWQISAIGDLMGDNRPEFLWENRVSGATVIWQLNINSMTGRADVNMVTSRFITLKNSSTAVETGGQASGWRIIGLGNFDSDVTTKDVLWFNDKSKISAVWNLKEGMVENSGFLMLNGQAVAAGDWQPISIANIDGMGNDEIVLQSGTGVVIWEILNNLSIGSRSLLLNQPLLAGEQIQALADLDMDGTLDLVTRRKSGGDSITQIHYLDGTTFQLSNTKPKKAMTFLNPNTPFVIDKTWDLSAYNTYHGS